MFCLRWQQSFPVPLLLWIQLLGSCSAQRIQPRIVGGQATTLSVVGGYVVNLRYDGQFFCGGSLVTRMFVVTAAHCVYDLKVNRLAVQGGVNRLNQQGVVRRARKIILPDRFNIERINMDVAVVKLRRAMVGKKIYTIPLCQVQWRAGDYMRVSGWGIRREGSEKNPIQLRTVRLQLIRKKKCHRMYKNTNKVYASAFCAQSQGKDSCTGDSGGGVIYKNQLCGIVSWGMECASSSYPGVYTSIHRARAFLRKAMRN